MLDVIAKPVDISVKPNIDKLFKTFKTLSFNIGYHQRLGAVNGYGHMNVVSIKVSMPTKVCTACGELHNTSLINARQRWGLNLPPMNTLLCFRHKWKDCDFVLFYQEHYNQDNCLSIIENKCKQFFTDRTVDDYSLPELDYYIGLVNNG